MFYVIGKIVCFRTICNNETTQSTSMLTCIGTGSLECVPVTEQAAVELGAIDQARRESYPESSRVPVREVVLPCVTGTEEVVLPCVTGTLQEQRRSPLQCWHLHHQFRHNTNSFQNFVFTSPILILFFRMPLPSVSSLVRGFL